MKYVKEYGIRWIDSAFYAVAFMVDGNIVDCDGPFWNRDDAMEAAEKLTGEAIKAVDDEDSQ